MPCEDGNSITEDSEPAQRTSCASQNATLMGSLRSPRVPNTFQVLPVYLSP